MSARAGRSDTVRPAQAPRPDCATEEVRFRPVAAHPQRTARIEVTALLERLRAFTPGRAAVVVGGGCAGLALGVAIADRGAAVTVVEARRSDRDGRTWCYWDTGESLLPEAASRSWSRWEIRTPAGRAVAADAAHPYRMVRARDYRAAARTRIAASPHGRLLDGTRVTSSIAAAEQAALFDARGPAPLGEVPPGRVLLHQRFVGQWIRTTRPVFDDSTVTLMDFPDLGPGDEVRFHYVLPVAPDLAMVECTVFSRTRHGVEPFRQHIADYLAERWDLAAGEWTVEGEEAGSIPMTDARIAAERGLGTPLGLRAGIARPSTGYAYTRIHRAARRTAQAFGCGGQQRPQHRDRLRTRLLDAVFLRFLRDQPQLAPAVFLRMFQHLSGPVTVRFLTERSSLLDDLRLILALPKAPFLRAAATTATERLRTLAP